MNVRVNSIASDAVVAARRGESVEARTEMRERIATMTSRFQSGQFCNGINKPFYCQPFPPCVVGLGRERSAYKRIIGVIGWLRDQKYLACFIILQPHISLSSSFYVICSLVLKDIRGPCTEKISHR